MILHLKKINRIKKNTQQFRGLTFDKFNHLTKDEMNSCYIESEVY